MDTKEREKLITEAAAEFEAGLRLKADQFEAAHAERKLTISIIEKLFGETRKLPDEILKRVYTELTNAGEEKLGTDEQGKQSITGQFHEPVVTDRNRGKTAQAQADVTPVIPFETAVTAELEQKVSRL